MRSQSNQQQYATYANAATASKGNTANGGMGTGAGVPGLTKTETKEMITTIMSAIVYSHYVEAINPGSFQSNMTDIYKRNGLKPVNFPTPPMTDVVLQSCREVFLGTQETNSEDKTDEQTTDNASNNQTDEDELTLRMVDDDVVTETTPMKRQWESLTPPNKDKIRKKEDGVENKETNLSTKKTSCNNEGLPQRRSGVGGARNRSNSRSKDKREKPRSDSPSTSSQVQFDKWTKSLGLKMYMKKSSNFDIISKDPRERNRIKVAAIVGDEVKFTWDSLYTERENIVNNLKKGTIDLNEIEYQKIDDTKFD